MCPCKDGTDGTPDSLFGGWFSAFGRFKTLLGAVILLPGICLREPCLLPLLIKNLKGMVEATVQQQVTAHIYFTRNYQEIPQASLDGECETPA